MKHTTEAERARNWRKNIVKLTRPELAKRTGYSPATIQIFERGAGYAGQPLAASAWQKYRMACAAVHWGACSFDWEHARGTPAAFDWSRAGPGVVTQHSEDRYLVYPDAYSGEFRITRNNDEIGQAPTLAKAKKFVERYLREYGN